jgi:hypothetical protein
MAIIGISGKIGSGKDTVGQIIQILTHNPSFTTEGIKEHLKINATKYYVGNVWHIKKFASKLKQIVALLTGCTVEDLESQEFKQMKLSKDWWHNNGWADIPERELVPWTYRDLLQKLGTEVMRNKIHENVWVNALFADYLPPVSLDRSDIKKEHPNWIITDMRFENEAEAIKKRDGLLIRIERMGLSESNHPSETALDKYLEFDYTIYNNETIDDLIDEVRTILKLERII